MIPPAVLRGGTVRCLTRGPEQFRFLLRGCQGRFALVFDRASFSRRLGTGHAAGEVLHDRAAFGRHGDFDIGRAIPNRALLVGCGHDRPHRRDGATIVRGPQRQNVACKPAELLRACRNETDL